MIEKVGDVSELQFVILAGGLGTRMRAIAGDAPKALIPVAGQPFAHHQLSLLASKGAARVVYCIGYGGDQIRRFVEDGSRWGLEVSYVDEGDHLHGTAGALRVALDAGALDKAFGVLYGDSYLPIDLAPVVRAFRTAELPVLMTVLRNNDRWDRSNVVYENGLVLTYDKHPAERDSRMEWIDYGLTILERRVIGQRVPTDSKADLADLYSSLSRERFLGGFEVTERFYEVGAPGGLVALERFLDGSSSPLLEGSPGKPQHS